MSEPDLSYEDILALLEADDGEPAIPEPLVQEEEIAEPSVLTDEERATLDGFRWWMDKIN